MIKKASRILFLCYVLSVIYLTFFIGRRKGNHNYRAKVNWELFNRKADFENMYPKDILFFFVDIVGNILLFLPLIPLLMLMRGKTMGWPAAAALSLACTVAIEGLQYFFAVGVCDINDVFLNFVGGMAGKLFATPFFKKNNTTDLKQ